MNEVIESEGIWEKVMREPAMAGLGSRKRAFHFHLFFLAASCGGVSFTLTFALLWDL